MAQLFFRYSTMNAGKSIELIKVAYNYEERGKHCLLYTSPVDCFTGDPSKYISCRGIAQLVEQWSPKPRAVGSNPTAPANN